MTVLLQVMTLFMLMLCGLSAAKTKLLSDQGLKGLNTLVLYFAQPALILHRLQTPASPELIVEIIWVFVLACATIGIAGVISFRLFAREEHQRRAVLTSLSMLSNCGFMGFPIITATMGDKAQQKQKEIIDGRYIRVNNAIFSQEELLKTIFSHSAEYNSLSKYLLNLL